MATASSISTFGHSEQIEKEKSFNSKKKKFHPNARNFLDFVWKIIMIIRYCTYYPDNNLPLEMNQKNIKERKNEKNGEGEKNQAIIWDLRR
jgi:hypothetical protein